MAKFSVRKIDTIAQLSIVVWLQVAKKDQRQKLDLYLDEKYAEPEPGCESKGFRDAQVIRDFPIRGKAVYLHVRRRKWMLPDGSIFSKTYDLTYLGTRITKEFAAFLKEAYRV